MQDRPPPHDLNAEMATLGAMLISREATAMGMSLVSIDDFYAEAHRLIFQAMVTIDRANQPVDLVTVSAELRRTDHINTVGGGDYLTALIGKVPTAAHVIRYANIVAEKSLLRKLIRAGADIQGLAYEDPDDPANAISEATQRLLRLSDGHGRRGLRPLPEVAQETYGRLMDEVSLPWSIQGPRFGIKELDDIMGGLANRWLLIIEGDTSFGKSSLCRQLAYITAKSLPQEAGQVLVYLLEDTEDMWMRFSAGRLCGIAGSRLRRGANLSDSEEVSLREAHTDLMRLGNLTITDDTAYANVVHLAASARLQALRGGVSCIIIDYVQMLRAPASNVEQRYVEVIDVLLSLAKDLRTPIILPSQVTYREGESFAKYCSALEEWSVCTIQIERAPGVAEMTKAERRGRKDCQLLVKKDRLGPAGYRVEVINDPALGTWYGREDADEFTNHTSDAVRF